MCLIEECRGALGGAGTCLEEIVRTARWHRLEEIGDVRKTIMLGTRTEEGELRLVVGVLIDLAVIELGGADDMRWFDERSSLFPERA